MLVKDLAKEVVRRFRGAPSDDAPESRPLHVCHVVERLRLGGIAARLVPIANGLDTDEFLVSCLSLGAREALVLEELEPRVQTWGLSFLPRSSLVGALVELFRRFQVDIVHTHGAGVARVVALAARAGGARAMVHTGYGETEPLRLSAPPTGLHFTAASAPAARLMAEALGRELAEIPVLPTGVDTERFRPPLDREALREGLGIDGSTLVVGSVSLAVEARLRLSVLVSTLRGRGVRATGLLVGASGQGDRAAARGEEVVLETGPTRDVASRLAAMDLMVVPGRSSIVAPVALLEGMASGLPVVAEGSPGVLDLGAEADGLIVADGLLEDEVERLARDAELRRRLGERARRFVERGPGRPAVIEAFSTFYRGLGGEETRCASF